MKYLLFAALIAVAGCGDDAIPAKRAPGELYTYPDSAHHVVCYRVWDNYPNLSCVYVPPSKP